MIPVLILIALMLGAWLLFNGFLDMMKGKGRGTFIAGLIMVVGTVVVILYFALEKLTR